jgi:Fe-S oxidoreductase
MGVEPRILSNERCCGHDLLWSGEVESFLKLAELNLKEIEKSDTKVVIFSCPECYYMFKKEYPKYFKIKKGINFFHIIEIVYQKLGEIKFKNTNKKTISYHDSCRLGRFVGLYNEPREIMEKMGIEVVEFEKNKNYNICCGSANWITCGKIGKKIQEKKIEEMKKKKVNTLGVSCPKCKIHFTCYIKEEKEKIKVEDLIEIINERIEK